MSLKLPVIERSLGAHKLIWRTGSRFLFDRTIFSCLSYVFIAIVSSKLFFVFQPLQVVVRPGTKQASMDGKGTGVTCLRSNLLNGADIESPLSHPTDVSLLLA